MKIYEIEISNEYDEKSKRWINLNEILQIYKSFGSYILQFNNNQTIEITEDSANKLISFLVDLKN